ncbi:hypothetical protein PLESTB_000259400 [Pleodorina starrii]|uniref:Uncharacterized protein n=1 Tax=Pleodorina starrii TaxID=330485 RepID=A0A9W6BDC5_9CHLO|nr:hypothetical protein PLESTM_001010300 [Pleodorina starrii]GLC49567.1 hypothetical protein PLESTB_000259400 [Pleodorina starrii]GLC77272.1 hypothetical protein PLESTF_001907300 [Pleodorina starrii]
MALCAGLGEDGEEEEEVVEALRGEVREYVQTGSLRPDGGGGEGGGRRAEPLVAANPTLLLVPELQYTVYFSSSIFRALPLSSEPGNATARLVATLAPQLDSLTRGLRDGDVSVRLVPGDILAAMLAVPPPPPPPAATGPDGDAAPAAAALQYDFIDCSNVADYVSLQALVQAAAPLLTRRPHARLRAESLVLYGSQLQRYPALTPAAFLAEQLRPSPPALQELLGLQLVEEEAVVWPGRGVQIVWGPDPDLDPEPDPADGAARSSWLTAPRLLLELLPACKALLTPAAAAGGGGGVAAGAPLSIVHLLSLSLAPQQLEPMVRCLARCDPSGAAALFKWELTMAALLQAGRL